MVHPRHGTVGTHLIPLILLFMWAVSASLAISQSLYDNDNIVGDPTIYTLDDPNVREKRQTSNNTGNRTDNSTATTDTAETVATTSGDNNGTNASPSGAATPTAKTMTTADMANATTGNLLDFFPPGNGTLDKNYTLYEDDHDYYTARYIPPDLSDGYWVDIDSMIGNAPADIKQSSLTISPRRAKQVELGFDFEFYGHDIGKILVTTGGFLYTGTYIHRFLAATQYIAPLMANFDPSITNATIKYAKNSTQFTAEWRNVSLADNAKAGVFTFQTTLYAGGRIVFAYKKIPIPVENIDSASHPVRTGLADAYYHDTFINPLLKKRSIYEYHKISLNFTGISSNSAIEMIPKATCHDQDNHGGCHQCVSAQIGFDCAWCPAQGRCSSGFDRYRQTWVENRCDVSNITVDADCNRPDVLDVTPTKKSPKLTQTPTQKASLPIDCTDDSPCTDHGQCVTDKLGSSSCLCRYPWIGDRCDVWKPDEDEDVPYEPNLNHKNENSKRKQSNGSKLSYGGIVFMIVFIVLIIILLAWVVYAYRRPTSNSGLFLIELRNKVRMKGSSDSNIKYKYHKPDLSDNSVERV